jgi:hypothetical protein
VRLSDVLCARHLTRSASQWSSQLEVDAAETRLGVGRELPNCSKSDRCSIVQPTVSTQVVDSLAIPSGMQVAVRLKLSEGSAVQSSGVPRVAERGKFDGQSLGEMQRDSGGSVADAGRYVNPIP